MSCQCLTQQQRFCFDSPRSPQQMLHNPQEAYNTMYAVRLICDKQQMVTSQAILLPRYRPTAKRGRLQQAIHTITNTAGCMSSCSCLHTYHSNLLAKNITARREGSTRQKPAACGDAQAKTCTTANRQKQHDIHADGLVLHVHHAAYSTQCVVCLQSTQLETYKVTSN